MGKDTSFEGLRGIAALVVIFSHLSGILYPYLGFWSMPKAGLQPGHPWETIVALPYFTIFYNGSFAVAIFFVLSGYVLIAKFHAKGDTTILRLATYKRYPRLVIPTLAAVLIAWAILSLGLMQTYRAPEIGGAGWPMAFYKMPISFWSAIWDGLVGAPFTGRSDLISPLWSIMVELKGSFGLFLIFALFARGGLVLTGIVFSAFCLLIQPGSSLIALMMSMYIGAVLNWVRPRLSGKTWLGAALILIGVYFGLFCYYEPLYWPLIALPLPNLPAPLLDWNEPGAQATLYRCVGAAFLVYGVTACAPASRLLSTPTPMYLGKLSFSSYLLHWPIICSFSYWFMWVLIVKFGIGDQLASLIMYAATLAVVFLASSLFEKCIDQPAIWFSDRLARYLMAGNALQPQVAASTIS